MKLLVDENLPPRLANLLTDGGHDAVHVRALDLATAPDAAILDRAAENARTIVSADTDFGALLAYRRAKRPSVILVRGIVDLRPPAMAERIMAQLSDLEHHLRAGAVIAMTRRGARIRPLPLR